MRGKDHVVALALAVLAGFVGGGMSGRLAAPEPVGAQVAPTRIKILETESVHLLDKAGRTRGALEVLGDGSAVLAIGNKDGVIRVRLGVENNGTAFLDLRDEKAQSRGVFLINSAGSPTLMVIDPNGRGGAMLGQGDIPLSDVGIVENRPAGSLIFLNKEGKVVWRAP